MKTVTLTVVVDDELYPRRMRIVLGAINGILPSLRRWATSAVVTVDEGKASSEEAT